MNEIFEHREQEAPLNRFCDLLVIDDIMPSTMSPFRTIEYSHYLKFFSAFLLSTEGWSGWLSNKSFNEFKKDLDPAIAHKVLRFTESRDVPARLAYVTFLGNIRLLWNYIQAKNIPFILQLYPGGAFGLDQPETDFILKQICESPLLRKVIATQTITRDYLINKIGCDAEKIEFIYGGVFESRNGFDFYRDKKIYPRDKETIDICFVAHKYGDDLNSKGFLDFIAIAKILSKQFRNLRCHVVGGYDECDADLSGIAGITFYGIKSQSFFGDFYASMDVIVSINRAFVLAPGAFDGFPTGACIEAGYHGVLNALSDPLNLNIEFTDGKDFLLMEGSVEEQAAKIADVLRDPDRLEEISYNNWKTFNRVFDANEQLWRRTKIISDELVKFDGLIINNINRKSDLDYGPIWCPPPPPTFRQKMMWALRNPFKAARKLPSMLVRRIRRR
jgi:glycosyltransferase involved in cell wall biosynthesis